MWLIIFGTVIVLTAAGVFYMVGCIGRFDAVKRIAGSRKWTRRLVSFGILAVCFAAAAVLFSPVNAIVIFLHVTVFFLLFGIAVRIAERLRGKKSAVNWQGWLALGFSVVYLSVAYVLCSHVWQTNYQLRTEKDLGTLRIALIADSHIGTTFDGEGFAGHLRTIEQQHPDLLVVAGDFVDDGTGKEDMLRACRALGEMEVPLGVWYAYGNHDRGYSRDTEYTASELEKTLRDNGVHILKDEAELVDGRFYVAGRCDRSFGVRKSMEELLSGLEKDKYIIVIDHQPNDYENEANSAADLVLSGHTHGGQLIPITYVGELFRILDSTYGHENRKGTDFIVTSGISDWELLFKTGTRSEYVIIDVTEDGETDNRFEES